MSTKRSLVKEVQNANTRNAMWNSDSTLVVGVSGGRDSMCLLDVLVRLSHKENLTLIVAHVNYSLRGADSLEDERLVRDFAKAHCLTLETHHPKDPSISDENSLRDMRRSFYEKISQKYEAHAVALAHHIEDQAETVLLHLIRGTGTYGLTGMQHISQYNKSETTLVRPFLGLSRDDITQHCARFNVPYRNDQSNSDTKYLRNRVRLELIPLLEEHYNPQIKSVLSSLSQIVSRSTSHMDSRDLDSHIKNWKIECEGGVPVITFSRYDFCAAPPNSQSRFLQDIFVILERSLVVRATTYRLPFSFIEECRNMILHEKNKPAQIQAHSLIITRKSDTVRIMFAL